VESLREQNDQVLQRFRESVTRVRTIAQKKQNAGHIAGGTSDRVHLMDTPA
jgi:Cft2 family RNA processing exonuclease